MVVIHINEVEFKEAIENKLEHSIDKEFWKIINEAFILGAIHAPYSQRDVDFAVRKIQKWEKSWQKR